MKSQKYSKLFRRLMKMMKDDEFLGGFLRDAIFRTRIFYDVGVLVLFYFQNFLIFKIIEENVFELFWETNFFR